MRIVPTILILIILSGAAIASQPTRLTPTKALTGDFSGDGNLTFNATTNGIFRVNNSGISFAHWSSSLLGNLTNASLTTDRNWVLPDENGTVALLTGGTLARSKLPSMIAYEDEANTFQIRQAFLDGLTVTLWAYYNGLLQTNQTLVVGENAYVNGAFRANSSVTFEDFVQGSILFMAANGLLAQDTTNFFWDDTNNQLQLNANGVSAGIKIGSDTQLYRSAAGILSLTDDDQFRTMSSTNSYTLQTGSFGFRSFNDATTDDAFTSWLSAGGTPEAFPRLHIRTDGRHSWGDGTANGDTVLYREGANILATDDKLHILLEAEIDGALNHDGTTVGFFGVAPVTQRSAWTQTYSTTSRTNSAITHTAVATTGATNVAPFGYTTAAQANDIVTQLNNALLEIEELKKLVNSLIDDQQALGLSG